MERMSLPMLLTAISALWTAAATLPLVTRLPAQERKPVDSFTRYLESNAMREPMSASDHRGPPLRFVENRGQWDRRARYRAQSTDLTVWLEDGGMVLDLSSATRHERRGVVVALRFTGAGAAAPHAAAELSGQTQLAGATHFLLGREPSGWQLDVPAWSEVVAKGVATGIDVRYRNERGLLRFDLEFTSAAHAAAIALDVDGTSGIETLADGRLRLATLFQDLFLSRPIAWQTDHAGNRLPVEVAFRVLGERRFGFTVGSHDPSLPLVIDPYVHWATYCGGTADEQMVTVARTRGNTVTIAGRSASSDYPTSTGAYQRTTGSGAWDAVVSKLDPTKSAASQLVFSTYLGGAGDDAVLDLVEDTTSGDLWLAGMSDSSNHPTSTNAWSRGHRGRLDATLCALDPSGKTLLYGTYYGSTGEDWANAIDLDSKGLPLIAGYTESLDLPAVNAYQPVYGGERDAYWARLIPGNTSTSIAQASYFGGPYLEGDKIGSLWNWTDLAVRLEGNELTIVTQSRGEMPTTAGSYMPAFPAVLLSAVNTHVARLDLAQTGAAQLRYATWFGGTTAGVWTTAYGMRVRTDGRVVLGGISYDPLLPTTPGAYVTTADAAIGPGADHDAFFCVLSPDLASLEYSTLLGGTASVGGGSFDVERSGAIIAGGYTFSSLTPTPGAPVETRPGGPNDLYLLRLMPEGKGKADMRFLSYSGGSGGEAIFDLQSDGQGGVTAGGVAASADFPVSNDAYQTKKSGGARDAMIAHFDLQPLGFDRLGVSQGSCAAGRFLGAVFDPSISRGSFAIHVTGGMANDLGALVLGTELSTPIPLPGVDAWVTALVVLPYLGDATGSADITLKVPATTLVGTKFGAQAFFLMGKGCSPLESTNGARFTVRP